MQNDRFKLESGERQVGETLRDVRKDHTNRYSLIIDTLKQDIYAGKLHGLDIFTATGYGAYMIANAVDCSIDAFDASDEAIQFALKHFDHPSVNYQTKIFPFSLKNNSMSNFLKWMVSL